MSLVRRSAQREKNVRITRSGATGRGARAGNAFAVEVKNRVHTASGDAQSARHDSTANRRSAVKREPESGSAASGSSLGSAGAGVSIALTCTRRTVEMSPTRSTATYGVTRPRWSR